MRFLKFWLSLFVMIAAFTAGAQDRFYTKTGVVRFYSKAPFENIEAINNTVTAVLDAASGNMQFAVQMKGFAFEKALMQQHFNENYVESDKFPRAVFKGALTDKEAIEYNKEGVYHVVVKGALTLHGVTKQLEVPGTIQVGSGRLLGEATFGLQLSDYNIAIPALVKDKVSNTVTITVHLDLQPLKG